MHGLIQKYNVPGPRYTSYPTVPYWDLNNFSGAQWKETVVKSKDSAICELTRSINHYKHIGFEFEKDERDDVLR